MSQRPLFPHPLLSTLMGLLWLLLNGFSVGQFVLGAFLGWVIPFTISQFWPQLIQLRRPHLLLPYLGRFTLDVIVANFQVARLMLSPLSHIHPALIEYPLQLQQEFPITLLAGTVTLTPGTVSVDYNQERHTLLIHALQAKDKEALIQTIKTRYEEPLKEMFEC